MMQKPTQYMQNMPSIASISKKWGVIPYQCQHASTNQYAIWLYLPEKNAQLTHMQHIIFNTKVNIVRNNRFGHAEYSIQTN